MNYQPTLGRQGATFQMNGEKDAFGNEKAQVVQYSAATKTYTDIGPLNTNYEGKTQVPG